MSSIHRHRWLGLAAAALLVLSGCMGTIEFIEGQSPEYHTTSTSTELESDGIAELETPELAGVRVRARVSCQVPAAWSYPYLLENAAEHAATATGSAGRVCLASDEAANRFCHWADRFDARYRALVSCFEAAKNRLWREVGVGLDAEPDSALVRGVASAFPVEWRDDLDPTAGLIGSWARLLLAGDGESTGAVDGAPFCMPAKRGQTAAEQVMHAADVLRWAWSTLEAEQQRITGVLRRGLSVRADGIVADLMVELAETAPVAPVADQRCYYRSFSE